MSVTIAPGATAFHSDPSLSKFQSRAFGESFDCVFTCDINTHVPHANMSGNTGGVYDHTASGLQHGFRLIFLAEQYFQNVNIEYVMERFRRGIR